MFFKLLFNEKSETIYPRENMLRVSDGKWDSQLVLRCIGTSGDTLKLIVEQLLNLTLQMMPQ